MKDSKNDCSYADVGLSKEILVDQKLEEGVRVTVRFPEEALYKFDKRSYETVATVVSPNEPRATGGYYWGYSVRVANSLSEVSI